MQKNFGIATVVGFLVLFFLGYALYGVALVGFFEANTGGATNVPREPMAIWAVAVGQLLFAAFLPLALGWKGVGSAADGAKAGMLVGFLVSLSYDLTLWGTTNLMNTMGTIGDVVVFTAISGVAGAAIGAMLNRGGGQAQAA